MVYHTIQLSIFFSLSVRFILFWSNQRRETQLNERQIARARILLCNDELLLFLATLNPFTLCVINATAQAALLTDFPSPRIVCIVQSCHMVPRSTSKPWQRVALGKKKMRIEAALISFYSNCGFLLKICFESQ